MWLVRWSCSNAKKHQKTWNATQKRSCKPAAPRHPSRVNSRKPTHCNGWAFLCARGPQQHDFLVKRLKPRLAIQRPCGVIAFIHGQRDREHVVGLGFKEGVMHE